VPGLTFGAASTAPAKSIVPAPEVILSPSDSPADAEGPVGSAMRSLPEELARQQEPAPPVPVPTLAAASNREAIQQQPADGRELVDQVVVEQRQEERLVEPPQSKNSPRRFHHRWRLPAAFVIPTATGGGA
jgi:hypothetical protein